MIVAHVRRKIGKRLLTLWLRLSKGTTVKVSGIIGLRRDTRILTNGGTVELGDGVNFAEGCFLNCSSGGLLHIGNSVNINRNCMFVCHKKIEIGNRCIFGPNVLIYDHDHAFNYDGIQNDEYKTGEVVIGDGCWIGAGVIVLRNTHIGEGCVIGAGTVLKGDIPSHSLVTSNRILNIVPIADK